MVETSRDASSAPADLAGLPWSGLETVLAHARAQRRAVYMSLIGNQQYLIGPGEARGILAAWPTATDGRGRFAIGAIATVADRTLLNSAVRPDIDSILYSTATLTVKILHEPNPDGPITAHGRVGAISEVLGASACTLVDASGREFGLASGTFVVARRPDHGAVKVMRPSQAEHAASEEAVLELHARIARHLETLGPAPSYPDLLAIRVLKADEQVVEAVFDSAPHLGNTVRSLHGGVLFGAAAQVAAELVPGWRIAEEHCQFHAGVGEHRVRLHARLLRRGRRVAFVEVDATVEQKSIGSMLCTMVPSHAG